MQLSKKQVSAQSILLAASFLIGSSSIAFAAAGDANPSPASPTSSAAVNAAATAKATAATAKTAANQANSATASSANAKNNTGSSSSATASTSSGAAVNSQSSGLSTAGTTVKTGANSTPAAGTSTTAPNSANATAGDAAKNAAAAGDASKNNNTADASDSKPSTSDPKKWHPGMELTIGTDTQDLVPTDDPVLAKKQVDAYPDSPEAAFIYAVSLTRTSRVEEALEAVKTARRLADAKGGPAYFDKTIATYEELLKNYPKENRVRYGLAWAYYMKAYLAAGFSRKVAKFKAAHPELYPNEPKPVATASATTPGAAPAAPPKRNRDLRAFLGNGGKPGQMDLGALLTKAATTQAPQIQGFFDGVDAADVPKIKGYFEQALKKLDELIAQKTDDVWALVYHAHLKAEYTGNIDEAMVVWKACSEKFPTNPAPYFFLGEGYMKKGDLKQSIINVSKAVALRGTTN